LPCLCGRHWRWWGGLERNSRCGCGPAGASAAADYASLFGIGFTGVLYYVALLTPSFIVSPGLVQKVYGARSAPSARLGIAANAVVLLFYAAVPALLGMIAAVRFPSLADPQYAVFRLFTEGIPVWLGVLGVAAVFSAEISTCDAVLFMLSSSLTIDFYRSFVHRQASGRTLLKISRVSAICAGAGAIWISIQLPSIIDALTLFYSLVSVALFVPVIAGIYWRRPTARAALAAILVSVPATVLLKSSGSGFLPRFLNPFLVGMLISFVVLWLVSMSGNRRAA
jgi:solute:Na+ symporter, SSS family